MDNKTLEQVVHQLNLSWAALEDGINAAYDEGYSAVVWKMKTIQLQIENLEVEIAEKEYGDEECD